MWQLFKICYAWAGSIVVPGSALKSHDCFPGGFLYVYILYRIMFVSHTCCICSLEICHSGGLGQLNGVVLKSAGLGETIITSFYS